MKPTNKQTSCNFIRWKQKSVELLSLQQLGICSLNKFHKTTATTGAFLSSEGREWAPCPRKRYQHCTFLETSFPCCKIAHVLDLYGFQCESSPSNRMASSPYRALKWILEIVSKTQGKWDQWLMAQPKLVP